MPLLPQNGTLGTQRAAHLLRRAAFGGTRSEIQAFASLSVPVAMDRLFRTTIPDAPDPVDPETGLNWVTTVETSDNMFDFQEYFVRWYLGRLFGSGMSDATRLSEIVREKMVFYLHTHFTTMRTKVVSGPALYYQNQLFRLFANDATDSPLGPRDFRTLTKKVSLDNAMVRFLDGNNNVKGSPNENYAREMMELYTIGRGLEGHVPPVTDQGDYYYYTEQDVRAAANVLTGYDYDKTFSNIDPETELPICTIKGNGGSHETDAGLKVFSARLGGMTIDQNSALLSLNNPTEESMHDELQQLVDMIFSQEATARSICRRIYRFYVHYEVTTEVENDIITDMAARFAAGGFRLQPVVEALLSSTHFYEAAAGYNDDMFGGIIKSPLELMAGAYHQLGIVMPDQSADAASFHNVAGGLVHELLLQGLEFYEPAEVAGYPAYHQYPNFNRNWITTNYLVNRYNSLRSLVESSSMGPWNIRYFIQSNFSAEAGDARQLITALARYLFPLAENLDFNTDSGSLTSQRLNYFLYAFLGANQYTEAEWSALYANVDVNYLEVESLLKSLLNAMLQTPEYQLF